MNKSEAPSGTSGTSVDGQRECLDCKVVKPESSFHTLQRNPERKRKKCNSCYHLRKKYGINDAQLHAMLVAQDFKCAICRNPLTKPHVDHREGTKEIRGILCSTCNMGLGLFYEDISNLEAAIEYLRDYG